MFLPVPDGTDAVVNLKSPLLFPFQAEEIKVISFSGDLVLLCDLFKKENVNVSLPWRKEKESIAEKTESGEVRCKFEDAFFFLFLIMRLWTI